MDATPTIAGDPRFIAGKRMRRAGRFEQAVQLLTEVLAVATEGKSEEEQLAPALAPVYYEYGVALMGACREAAAAGEADAEASADGPSAKRRKLDGDADEPGDGGDEADDDDDDDGDDGDDDDDDDESEDDRVGARLLDDDGDDGDDDDAPVDDDPAVVAARAVVSRVLFRATTPAPGWEAEAAAAVAAAAAAIKPKAKRKAPAAGAAPRVPRWKQFRRRKKAAA